MGCTYNHLVLVLDGARKPSVRLDAEILALLSEAKPGLLEALDGVPAGAKGQPSLSRPQ